MRSFFKSELENLHIKTGLLQYFKLSEMTDADGNPDGERQLKLLLDTLVQVCEEFSYIPDKDKKRIIQQSILRDTEYTGINPRQVWKWLNSEKGKYFKEEAHKPTVSDPNVDATPKTFDELSPELQKQVNDLLTELQQPSKFKLPEVTQADIDAIKAEDEIKAGQAAEEYSLADFEREDKLYRMNKKVEYGRLFSDPNSFEGKLLPDSPTFEKWLNENP